MTLRWFGFSEYDNIRPVSDRNLGLILLWCFVEGLSDGQ